MTKPDMGDLHDHRRAAQQDDFVAPVELEGFSIRLTHKPAGKRVPDAVVFARRLDMEPDGMPTVTADLEAVPSEEPGVYRFRTNLGMDGNWRLSVAAKIQAKVVKFAGVRWQS